MEGDEMEIVWYDGLNSKTIYKGNLKVSTIKVILEDRTCITVSKEDLETEIEPEVTVVCRTPRMVKEESIEVGHSQEVIVPEFLVTQMDIPEKAFRNVDSSTCSSDNVMTSVDSNAITANEDSPCVQEPEVVSNSQDQSQQDSYSSDMCSYPSLTLNCHQDEHCHSNSGIYTCNICRRCFDSQFKLDSHQLIHYEDRQFVCKVCSKGFKHNCSLMAHMVIHTGEKPYSCFDCEKCFSTTTGLKDHHRRIHSKEKPYTCKVCSRNFVSASEVTQHHRRAHARELTWLCQYCSKKFLFPKELRAHVNRMHLKYRPFECQLCGQKFFKPAELKTHNQRQHGAPE